MLEKNMQLTGADTNKSQTVINTSIVNTDISIERVFKFFSGPTRAHVLTDNVKQRKRASNIKWTESEYHVQYNKDVQQK